MGTGFVDTGSLLYSLPSPDMSKAAWEFECKKSLTNMRDSDVFEEVSAKSSDGESKGEALKPNMWVSEAGIWVKWENQGRLVALCRSILLALDAKGFEQVLCEYTGAYASSILYAKEFIRVLQSMNQLTDMLRIDVFFTT